MVEEQEKGTNNETDEEEMDEEADEEAEEEVDEEMDEEVDEAYEADETDEVGEADEVGKVVDKEMDEEVDEGADKDVVARSEDEDAQKEAMEEGELPYYSGFYHCLEFSKDFEARRGKVGTGIERVWSIVPSLMEFAFRISIHLP